MAEALDGSDYISLNLYHLSSGDLLKPCEMPEAKVAAFVMALEVTGKAPAPAQKHSKATDS